MAELFCGLPELMAGVIPERPCHPAPQMAVFSSVPVNSSSSVRTQLPDGLHDGFGLSVAFTVMLSGCVAVLLPLSVTSAVKLALPAAVGVPEMTPVEAARPSPAGRVPVVIDQAYGKAPPVALSVDE